ncbi:hypothetical protein BC332_30955 [Capsicum chinense]|nr:hypothetical protein BC332_30955 [Capsicum chinense]
MSNFLTLSLKSVIQTLLPRFKEWFNNTPNKFDSTNKVLKLYERGIKLPQGPVLKAITNSIPLEILKDIIFKEFPQKSKLDPNIYGNQTVDSLLKFDAKNENCHSISALIDASANVNRRDSNRDSVMSLDMKLGNLDSVQVLIESDPNSKNKIPLLMSLGIYVPRDKLFGHLKMSDFLTLSLKSIMQMLLPRFKALFDN